MQTLESILKKGTTILKDNGLEEAGLDAWLLLEFKTGKNRAYYFAHGDEPVSDETAAEYLTLTFYFNKTETFCCFKNQLSVCYS